MKIVHHYVNSCFDWLISGHQSVNPSREAISVLSGKHRRFTFVHPVYPGSEPSILRDRRGKGKKALRNCAPNSVLPITYVTTPYADLPLGAFPPDLQLKLQLHGTIYRPDSFVLMLRYCVNLKAIRYESTSLNRIREAVDFTLVVYFTVCCILYAIILIIKRNNSTVPCPY